MELIAFAREEGVLFSLRKTTHEVEGGLNSDHPPFWELSIQGCYQERSVIPIAPNNRDNLNDSVYRMDRAFRLLEDVRNSRFRSETRETRRRQLLAELTEEDKELLGLT